MSQQKFYLSSENNKLIVDPNEDWLSGLTHDGGYSLNH